MEHSAFALGDVEPQVTLDEWVDPAEEVLRDMELQAIGTTTPDVPQVHGQAQSSGSEAGLGALVISAPDLLPTMDIHRLCTLPHDPQTTSATRCHAANITECSCHRMISQPSKKKT